MNTAHPTASQPPRFQSIWIGQPPIATEKPLEGNQAKPHTGQLTKLLLSLIEQQPGLFTWELAAATHRRIGDVVFTLHRLNQQGRAVGTLKPRNCAKGPKEQWSWTLPVAETLSDRLEKIGLE